jgi:hypothetical protein
MLIYGDRTRTADPRRRLAEIERLLAPADPSRDACTHALIASGELAQGLADAEVEQLGCDDVTPMQTAAMALSVAIAGRAYASAGAGPCTEAVAALAAMPLPARIRCKQGEGFAFYAVYPDCYAAAAAAHPWGAPPLVIGLRSIGTGLAAAVAAVSGGRAISLRPRGHPFRREIRASERLRTELAAHRGPFAIVDEGPGLSGSSFGSVADLLEELGVAPDRIAFMPSHAGPPGPEASARHRERWERARRLVRTFDDLLAADPLEHWFEPDIGPALAEDISAGAWRQELAQPWPPAAPAFERRKLRLRDGEGAHVARFAGLGRAGEDKLARARALYEAGYGPQPIALRRGFLLERWVTGTPLDPERDRDALLDHLGHYLRFRARNFPAAAEEGAGPDLLRQMAIANAAELCGSEAAARIAERLERLGSAASPVHVDGRLHIWEWRRIGGGFCKLDGIDHSCGHDLVGAQDIAWDVAGASVELALTEKETADLARMVGADALRVDALAICYAAFQGGFWTVAERSASGAPAEAAGLRRRVAVYEGTLARAAGVAEGGGPQTPAVSPAASRAR